MSGNLGVYWWAFSVPKEGNTPEENEDTFRPSALHRRFNRTREFRACIADGATQSSFSSQWARLLVKEVMKLPQSQNNLRLAIRRASQQWWQHINTLDLAWNVEWKVRGGAHATLLSLVLRDEGFGSSSAKQ